MTTGVNYTSDRWDLYIYTASGTAERSQVKAVNGNTVDVSGLIQYLRQTCFGCLCIQIAIIMTIIDLAVIGIQKITEQERGTFQVIAIKYDEAKYDYVNKASASYGSSKSLSKGKNKVLDISRYPSRSETHDN